MVEQFKYDVFISYSSQDKPAARELAKRMCRDGVCVWLNFAAVAYNPGVANKEVK